MSIRHEDRYPSAQTVSFQNEIPRLPSQNAERETVEGKVHSRVLLVEDEPLLRKVISRQLVSAGYVVRVAVDGLDAIGAFGNFFWPISGGLIWPTLGRCRLGKAFASPSRKNKDRRRSCGNVGIPPLRRDFQGRWEGWETVLGFSTPSTARHFHS
jgi:hypothetical protein